MGRTLSISFIAVTAFALSLWYILATFSWVAIAAVLGEARWELLVFGVAAQLLLFWGLRALRWQLLLRVTDMSVPFFPLYLTTAVTVGLAVLTPLQGAEVAKIELVRRYGSIDRAGALATFAAERGLDLAALGLILVAGFILGAPAGVPVLLTFVPLALLLLLVLALLLVYRSAAFPLLEGFRVALRLMLEAPAVLGLALLLSVLAWVVTAAGWYICFLSLALELRFDEGLLVTAVMALVNIASFIPGGLGVGEAGTAWLLQQYAIAEAEAQSAALLLRAHTLLSLMLALLHLPMLRCLRRAPTGAES